jgi:hypothetical protein
MTEHSGFYVLMELEQPCAPLCAIGVLLLDTVTDTLHVRSWLPFDDLLTPEDTLVLKSLVVQIADESLTSAGSSILMKLESSFSNAVRLSGRCLVQIDDPDATLADIRVLHHVHVGVQRGRQVCSQPLPRVVVGGTEPPFCQISRALPTKRSKPRPADPKRLRRNRASGVLVTGTEAH